MKKLIAILVALAMAAMLSISAFAAEGDEETVTPPNLGDVFNLEKTFEMPTGTTIPTAVFKFDFTQNTTLGDSTSFTVDTDNVVEISFSASDSASATTSGDKTVLKKSVNGDTLFAGLTTPGKYVFDIQENETTSRAANNASADETYTYQTTKYRLRVYVDKDGNKKYTLSEVNPTTGVETKDPAGGTGTQGDPYTYTADYTNTYVKTKTVTPTGGETDANGFSLAKTVTNDDAGLYDTKQFAFTVSVDIPSLSSKTAYNYKIVKADGTVATDLETPANQKIGTIGEAGATVYLAKGEKLVFEDLDIGATVTYAEADYAPDFTQTAQLNDEQSYAATTSKTTGAVTDTSTYAANVTNAYAKGNTGPEGILISNLPYIALALVAIGGLVAYVVVRRKADDEA